MSVISNCDCDWKKIVSYSVKVSFLYLRFWSGLQMIVEPLCEDAGYGKEGEKQQSHHSLPYIDLVI